MRALLFAAVNAIAIHGAWAVEQQDIYSTDYWELPGPPNKITWLEIHNSKEAKTSGLAHVSVLTRKRGAPVWDLDWVCDHIAVTTEALKRSVTRPFKARGAYPERFYEALHRWQDDEKNGKASICSTSIQEWLKDHGVRGG